MKIITKLFFALGVIASIVLFIIGIGLGSKADKIEPGIFWTIFQTYFVVSICILISTVALTFFMMGVCIIIDNLKEINSRLALNEQYKLPIDHIRKIDLPTDSYKSDDEDDEDDEEEDEYEMEDENNDLN